VEIAIVASTDYNKRDATRLCCEVGWRKMCGERGGRERVEIYMKDARKKSRQEREANWTFMSSWLTSAEANAGLMIIVQPSHTLVNETIHTLNSPNLPHAHK
jgi:hypothetical protein